MWYKKPSPYIYRDFVLNNQDTMIYMSQRNMTNERQLFYFLSGTDISYIML